MFSPDPYFNNPFLHPSAGINMPFQSHLDLSGDGGLWDDFFDGNDNGGGGGDGSSPGGAGDAAPDVGQYGGDFDDPSDPSHPGADFDPNDDPGGLGPDDSAGGFDPNDDPGGLGSEEDDSGGGDGGGDSGGSSGADSGGGGFGCFAGNTKISMADGTVKNISDIKCGDLVKSFDGEGPTKTGLVIATFSRKDADVVKLSNGSICTPDHRFLTNAGFLPIADVTTEFCIKEDGSTIHVYVDHKSPIQKTTVYNFTVSPSHTYIADELRVHNIKHKGGYISENRIPGLLGGDVSEVLQEGEFVISRPMVKKYGKNFFKLLNSGRFDSPADLLRFVTRVR
jgi:hypothetical protein